MSSYLTFTAASGETVYVQLGHGDSRLGTVYEVTAPTFDTRSKQYVNSSAVANGYDTLTSVGITDVTTPYQNPVNNQGDANIIPMHYANAQFVSTTGDVMVYVGGGYNGAKVAGSGHTLGPGDSVTLGNIANMTAALAQAASDYTDAAIVPLITIVATTNDVPASVDPVLIHDAYLDLFAEFFTAFPTAKITVVSICPDMLDLYPTGAFDDTAQRVAALKTDNVVFCQLPMFAGIVHEGEVSGLTPSLTAIETAGTDYYGRSILVASGNITPDAPVFGFSEDFSVETGSNADVTLHADKRVYWTINTGGSVVELSDDFEFDVQVLRPVGGTWGAAGTHAYSLDWRDADGLTGTLSGVVTITAAASPVTWLLYDDVARADVAQGDGVVGNSSGKDGTGGGIAAVGWGGITGGKLNLSGAHLDPGLQWDTGTLFKEFEVTVTVGQLGRRPAKVYCAIDPIVGDAIWWVSDNGANSAIYFYRAASGLALIATGARLPAGTYDIKVGYYSDGHMKAFVDGVEVMDGTSPFGLPSIGATGVGVGIDGANPSVLFANPRSAVTIP